jgi:hypothetical protein
MYVLALLHVCNGKSTCNYAMKWGIFYNETKSKQLLKVHKSVGIGRTTRILNVKNSELWIMNSELWILNCLRNVKNSELWFMNYELNAPNAKHFLSHELAGCRWIMMNYEFWIAWTLTSAPTGVDLRFNTKRSTLSTQWFLSHAEMDM